MNPSSELCLNCKNTTSLSDTVFIQPCTHKVCKDCADTLFESIISCPECNVPFDKVSTLQYGIESIFSFLQRLDIDQLPSAPMSLKRQSSCGGGNDSEDHMKLIPSHPVLHNEQFSAELTTLHSTSEDNIGCFTLIASSDTSVTLSSNDDIVLIVDISGSMDGEPIKNCIDACVLVIENLKPSQRLSIVLFNHSVRQLFPLQHVTATNREQLITLMQNVNACGGTLYDDSFKFSKNLFEEAKTESERNQILLFFSDGEPNEVPNLSIMKDLFDTFPKILFYAISMQNGIDASKNMIPLLCDRSYELSKYIDIPDMSHFSTILLSIVGEFAPNYATNINVLFTNAIPNTSLARINPDGTYTVIIDVLKMDDACNIAYDIVTPDFTISYFFTKDGEQVTGTSILDTRGIIPIEISLHYPRTRKVKNEMNDIITNNTTTPSEKQSFLRDLLTRISSETHGIYYHELTKTIETIIDGLEPGNKYNMEIQNRGVCQFHKLERQTSGRQTSRQISVNLKSSSI